MHTGVKQELAELSRWQLRWQFRQYSHLFTDMVEREFLPPEEQHRLQFISLSQMALEAADNVPYYHELFQKLQLDSTTLKGTDWLSALPILNREDVQDNFSQMCSPHYSVELGNASIIKTSGTTGQPVEVLQSNKNLSMFALLKQRELRMFRFDTQQSFASIRSATDLPKPNGKPLNKGEEFRLNHWPLVGQHFQTGSFVCIGNNTNIEQQVLWLQSQRPSYLLAHSADLEHLALTYQPLGNADYLNGMLAISQQMKDSMRRNIARSFPAPLHQNYGLNEIGLVASRCPESDHYHVHAEHCFVEVTDNEGRPLPPGQQGHLLITSLGNPAMPLLRYDSDDLAELPTEPCPCGRTLFSFRNIEGRYRRNAYLPEGTWEFWDALLNALNEVPKEQFAQLRQYQLHQYRDGRFQLRIVAAKELAVTLETNLRQCIEHFLHGAAARLELLQVDEIPRPASGKIQNFTSDYIPD